MLRTFWDAALTLDPAAPDEGRVMRFQDADELARLWSDAGLREVETAPLDVAVEYAGFDTTGRPSRAARVRPARTAWGSATTTALRCARPAGAAWARRRARSR